MFRCLFVSRTSEKPFHGLNFNGWTLTTGKATEWGFFGADTDPTAPPRSHFRRIYILIHILGMLATAAFVSIAVKFGTNDNDSQNTGDFGELYLAGLAGQISEIYMMPSTRQSPWFGIWCRRSWFLEDESNISWLTFFVWMHD